MPPRSKVSAGLSRLIDSDSDPDLDHLESVNVREPGHGSLETKMTRPRGRPPLPANRISKPAHRGARQANASTSRNALAVKRKNASSLENPHSTIPGDDDIAAQDDEVDLPQPEREAPTTTKAQPSNSAMRGQEGSKPGRGRPPKSKLASAEGPLRTQPSDPVVDNDEAEQEAETDEDGWEGQAKEVYEEAPSEQEYWESHDNNAHATISAERAVRARPIARLESKSASTDAMMSRELDELKRRYESLETRHNELREVGVKDAERNYERLKKQAEESANVTNKLITELKAELAYQTQRATRLEISERNCDHLQTKVTELENSISVARSEIKTLSTKLAAARNTDMGAKVPGSALKATAGGKQALSTEVVQVAQAKEDLYCDLTGLIIRGMKHGQQENVFDCLQTGRNGTLHFKLALDASDARDNYEDVQYTYRPQLDTGRDDDLMDVLPDYLQEEIVFPRPQAPKFFARVTKSLTERLA